MLDRGNYEKNPKVFEHVRNKMRELGRLVIAAQNIDPMIRQMSDLIAPDRFDALVKATKVICGYDPDTREYKTPSLALKTGHAVNECLLILRGQYSRKMDKDNLGNLKMFKNL